MKLTNLMRWTANAQPEGYTLVGNPPSTLLKWMQRFSREPWSQVPKSRLLLASLASTAIFGGTVAAGIMATRQSNAYVKVFANGSYVGLVPNHQNVTSALERVAIGYHVNVSLSPVHTVVAPGYDWRRVESLPTPAVAIDVDGKPVAYTATKVDAEQVLSDVKLALTPKTMTPSAVVSFVKPIRFNQTTVGIADIWTPVAAAEHILHPTVTYVSGRSVGLDAIVASGLSQGHSAVRRTQLTKSYQPSLKSNERTSAVNAPVVPTATTLIPGVGGLTDQNTNPLVSLKVTETVQKTVHVQPPVHYVKDATLAVGTNKVVAKGTFGVAKEKMQLEFINGHLKNSAVTDRRLITAPQPEVVAEGTNNGIASGSWQWPSPYTDITSPFGWRILFGRTEMHPGVDIGCPIGTPIYASNNGVVEQAGWNNGGYGNWVLMNNGNGIETVYGHMSHVSVNAGETVTKGQIIGYSGETGEATGPHLHYEVRINGTPVEPTPYM